MNPILKLLLWKEWRENRFNFYFGAGFLVIFKLLQVYLTLNYQNQLNALYSTREGYAFISIVFCCVYGLIIGVGIFALEYTSGTLPYLFTRPIPRKYILSSKWLIGLTQILLLGLLGWFFTLLPPTSKIEFAEIDKFIFLAYFLFAPIPLYIISVFWSVILKDVTRATIISFITFVLGITLVRWTLGNIYSTWSFGKTFDYQRLSRYPDILLLACVLLMFTYSVIHFSRQQMK